jgi:hypothetical protein
VLPIDSERTASALLPGTLAARDVDMVGADFFPRQANEFAASPNRRPVIKFVAHGPALAH